MVQYKFVSFPVRNLKVLDQLYIVKTTQQGSTAIFLPCSHLFFSRLTFLVGERKYLFSEANYVWLGVTSAEPMGLLIKREKEADNLLVTAWDTALRSKTFPVAVRWLWEWTESKGAWISWKMSWKQKGSARLCCQ